jgi:hypothetical protein
VNFKIFVSFKILLLCLAVRKEKDIKSLLTSGRNALEKTDIKRNNKYVIN